MNSLSPLQLYREYQRGWQSDKLDELPRLPAVDVHPAPSLPPSDERQRWGLWPVRPIEPARTAPCLTAPHEKLLSEHVARQGTNVAKWIDEQAHRYRAACVVWPDRLCRMAATIDCILWQREPHAQTVDRSGQIAELVEMLSDVEAFACDLTAEAASVVRATE
ncbi:MAG: hypothetical protein K8T26_19605 [Lentisphaerae bacterium]|nr:hypothetical protein [Lentisphaerota bacterium]